MRKIAYILLPLFLAGVLFSVWKIISIEITLHSADNNYNYLAELASGTQKEQQNQYASETGKEQGHDVSAPSTESDSHAHQVNFG